jgi:hypothetical protein
MEMDEDSRVTIDYLRGLPDGAEVRWSSHHVSTSHPWASGWIDIRIVDEGAPPMNWAWTIITKDDPDGTRPEQLWQFVWPYDRHDVSEAHDVRGAWSVETVSQALADWATRHAGRPDLRFAWDPEGEPPPAVAVAAQRARDLAEGAPTWDLGDGLKVADGLMDELLAMDPDERDEVLAVLREARRDGTVPPGDGSDVD